MKISLNWLKDYVSIKESPAKLAQKLTMAGLEVKGIESAPKSRDAVFELEITPNRPDCLNMVGIAREIAAVTSRHLEFPKIRRWPRPKKKCAVKVADKKACPQYLGTVIEDVEISGTPPWIQRRLAALGGRSINNVVDITNFCLLELGQPLHAFDYDKLAGGKIVVRFAEAGEKIVTIDGVERDLDPSILVIADAEKPVAIAGVMGGKGTEVIEQTRNILLESAYFDPGLIRRASRKLGLSSDSSYRFERGVDAAGIERGASRALSLILQYARGALTRQSHVIAAQPKRAQRPIVISLEEINSSLGAPLKPSSCRQILKKLEFDVQVNNKGVFRIKPPSFREDIREAVDIVEEIARITGYEQVPVTFPKTNFLNIPSSGAWQKKKRARDVLRAQGFDETITCAMGNQAALEKSGLGKLEGIKIQNPLSLDQEMMRPSLLPSLLSVLAYNLNRGQKDLKLFEIGKVYTPRGERETLALLATGARLEDWRKTNQEPLDFYDLKGVIEETLKKSGSTPDFLEADPSKSGVDPDCPCAIITAEGRKIGAAGKLSGDVLKSWEIKQGNVFFAQVDLEDILRQKRAIHRFQPPCEYPAVVRDVSLSVDKDVSFKQVKEISLSLGQGLLQDIHFKEEYLGEKISSGHRGLVFSLIYQSPQWTLTEEEVNTLHERICAAFVRDLGAVRR